MILWNTVKTIFFLCLYFHAVAYPRNGNNDIGEIQFFADIAYMHVYGRVFNTCKWNNMAETAELRLFLCQVYKNLMLYGVVFHVKQWYNGGYETLV